MRRYFTLILAVMLALLLISCGTPSTEETGTPLEFTVVPMDDLPGELLQILESKKEAPFALTYADKGFLYIAVGAGKQPTTGYSYAVHGLWLTDNAITIDTELLGPSVEDRANNVPSYPFVVIKLEHRDEPVVFR